MTAPEIARAMSIPLNTVYSRLRVAREELELALRRDVDRDEPSGPVLLQRNMVDVGSPPRSVRGIR